jgi:multimeric flavodoxin WrbA
MQNKVGAAFATGGSISNGKEVTMMAILEAMLINKMIVVSAGGSFGFGASTTTGPDSPQEDLSVRIPVERQRHGTATRFDDCPWRQINVRA